jgi:hypothetical protein
MSSAPLYDTLETTYTLTRRTEPRIAEQLWVALGDARTMLNVGAGTGSHEPINRAVTAVEPSAVMRAQQPHGAARCVAATAERLPFRITPSTPRWPLPRCTTGTTRSQECSRCVAWPTV